MLLKGGVRPSFLDVATTAMKSHIWNKWFTGTLLSGRAKPSHGPRSTGRCLVEAQMWAVVAVVTMSKNEDCTSAPQQHYGGAPFMPAT